MAAALHAPEDFRDGATGAAATKKEQLFVKTGVPPPADQVTRNVAFPIFAIDIELDASFVLVKQVPDTTITSGITHTNQNTLAWGTPV